MLQRRLLGRPTRNEKISFVVGAGLLLGFIAQPLHGIHPAWIAVLAFAALGAMRVVILNTLRAINWSFALLFGMLASMSKVFSDTGLDRWIAGAVSGVVGNLAAVPVLFVAALTLLCFAVSFVLRWQAAAPLITIALAPVADAAGIHPFVVGLVALIACNGFFLPYQSTTYLAMYHGSGGKLFTHAQARPAAIAYGVVTLLALCASVFAWRAVGLL
jgi:di/tricarboxylate transporter